MSMQGITDPKTALTQAITMAFSDMAFLDAAETGGATDPAPTSQVVVTGFTSPVRGQIVLYLTLDCKRAIVENVYGREWASLRAAEIDDCLLELGNVVAGGFLEAYCGKGTAHDVSLPGIHFDDSQLELTGDRITATYDAEGKFLNVVLCLEP
jgi:CheY-specific phosphatase CheX